MMINLIYLFKMQLSISASDTLQSTQHDRLQQLRVKKVLYEQAIIKNQTLSSIIAQKQSILNSLTLSNFKLENEVANRSMKLCELQDALQQFQRIESEVLKLEERERQMQSQYDDYFQLNSKLERQIKRLQEECQIVKGRTIIDYNRLTQIRDDVSQQLKQKEILEKHHEELKKKSQALKKKIHVLKQQLKKTSYRKHRIQQADMERQLKDLRLQIEYKESQLKEKQNSRDKYLNQQQYSSILKQSNQLQNELQNFQDHVKLNQKLMEDKIALEQRIKFLEGVDIQFINQKKMLLRELKQKYILKETSMRSEQLNLLKKEQQLKQFQKQYPQGLSHLKKLSKKKKQQKSKVKVTKKSPQTIQQSKQKEVQVKISKFKWYKLKKALFGALFVFLILGLVLDRVIDRLI